MLSKSPNRIFIDATYTICSGKSSGIERVVRNLLRECAELAENGEAPHPKLVVSRGGHFYELPTSYLQAFQRTAAMQSNVLKSAPQIYQRLAGGICNCLRSRTFQKWLLPQPGHLGIFKLWHTYRELSVFRDLAKKQNPISARSGDLFLLPDAYWVNRLRHSVWPAAADARAHGAAVASVIYDLIPLTHPEFVGWKRRDAFFDYLIKASRHSDLLATISNTVLQQLSDFLENESGIATGDRPMLRSFELGAEIRSIDGSPRSEVRRLFDRPKTPYLMVATFDPRKNHHYLLDAFEALWRSNQGVELCLVGRFGSRCDDVLDRISGHPLFGKQLHLFTDLSDAELQHCYTHARGVIFPSVVEGFGLPIVESLWFGKKTFVSDTPIHREVGRQDCVYFDLNAPESLAQLVSSWEQTLASEAPILPTRRPISWRDSCRHLLSHCFDLFDCPASSTSAHPVGPRAA